MGGLHLRFPKKMSNKIAAYPRIIAITPNSEGNSKSVGGGNVVLVVY